MEMNQKCARLVKWKKPLSSSITILNSSFLKEGRIIQGLRRIKSLLHCALGNCIKRFAIKNSSRELRRIRLKRSKTQLEACNGYHFGEDSWNTIVLRPSVLLTLGLSRPYILYKVNNPSSHTFWKSSWTWVGYRPKLGVYYGQGCLISIFPSASEGTHVEYDVIYYL